MITVTSLVHPTMIQKIREGLKLAALGRGHEMGGHGNRVYIARKLRKGETVPHNIMRIDWLGNGKFIAYGGADWGQTDVTDIVKQAVQRGCSSARIAPRASCIEPSTQAKAFVAGNPSLKARLLKLAALAGIGLALTGCNPNPGTPASELQYISDQELRAKRFDACMVALPAGPKETVYNDWSEVVDSCDSSSRLQSLRLARKVDGVWQWADIK